ncbi:unnamed protein product [Rotaria sordida]|uniref:PiggyBac transposable element-derived protein domain-containing protein n=1 Tax=Rotaria sordida TaxID=392033 RepID=A0A815ADG1_9BILA|nr:unnamed protein product [Rotaria sordida]
MATRHQTLSDYEIQEILADSASESEAEIEGGGEEEDNYADMEVDEPEETSINFSASNRRTTRNQNIPSQIWSTEKDQNLYVDNWYTSPFLFEMLHSMKTGACGTVRSNRIHLTDSKGIIEIELLECRQYSRSLEGTEIF